MQWLSVAIRPSLNLIPCVITHWKYPRDVECLALKDCKKDATSHLRFCNTFERVSMGLTVNRQMALKLTVNRQKRNIFTVNRQMSEPKLAVKLLR